MLGSESKVRSIVRGVDDVIARTESVLVTTAALLMTATVSLDIIQRAFSRPESKLGEKILSLCGLFGLKDTPETQAFMADYVSPIILALMAFMAGWAVYGASCRRGQKAASLAMGLGCGLMALVVAYGLVQGILVWPSRWVCFFLIIAGELAWLAHTYRFSDGVRRLFAW